MGYVKLSDVTPEFVLGSVYGGKGNMGKRDPIRQFLRASFIEKMNAFRKKHENLTKKERDVKFEEQKYIIAKQISYESIHNTENFFGEKWLNRIREYEKRKEREIYNPPKKCATGTVSKVSHLKFNLSIRDLFRLSLNSDAIFKLGIIQSWKWVAFFVMRSCIEKITISQIREWNLIFDEKTVRKCLRKEMDFLGLSGEQCFNVADFLSGKGNVGNMVKLHQLFQAKIDKLFTRDMLAKIRLSNEDLSGLFLDEKVIPKADRKIILIKVFKGESPDEYGRMVFYRCPFYTKCRYFARNMFPGSEAYFLCDECPVFKSETSKQVEREIVSREKSSIWNSEYSRI